MRLRRGFTLVEAGIVILLVAISASFIVPRLMPAVNSQRSESFRQDALTLVREARERAVSTGRAIAVVADNSLRSEYDDASAQDESGTEGPPTAIRTRALPEGTELSTLWLGGETVDQSSFRLVFYPAGDATPAVMQFDQGGRLWHILVEGGTGRTSLLEGEYVDEGETKWPAGNLEIRGGGEQQ
jgi:type II secretory pathway pseudopilin PulG